MQQAIDELVAVVLRSGKFSPAQQAIDELGLLCFVQVNSVWTAQQASDGLVAFVFH